jgi:hypothetical protein
MKIIFAFILSCFLQPTFATNYISSNQNLKFDSTTIHFFWGVKLGMPYFIKSTDAVLNNYSYSKNELNYEGFIGNTKGLSAELYFSKIKSSFEFNFTYTRNQYFVNIHPAVFKGKIINPDISVDEYFDRVLYLNKTLFCNQSKMNFGLSAGYYSIWNNWNGEALRAFSCFNIGKSKRFKINLFIEKRWSNKFSSHQFKFPIYAFVTMNYRIV